MEQERRQRQIGQWLTFEKIYPLEKYKTWLQYQFIEATYYKIFKKKCSNKKLIFRQQNGWMLGLRKMPNDPFFKGLGVRL